MNASAKCVATCRGAFHFAGGKWRGQQTAALLKAKFLVVTQAREYSGLTMMISDKSVTFRFSGHETFACRYAWLPKAVAGVLKWPDILTARREDDAMIELGVGKNMVRSIRFWSESAGIIEPVSDGHAVTDFGKLIFLGGQDHEGGSGADTGLDPYLEDIQTLWLIHWKLSTNHRSLILAWDFLLNRFQQPELYASAVVRSFHDAIATPMSSGSLGHLWEVFLHSYSPSRGRKGEVREDNLDCPLVELGLLLPTGGAHISEKSSRAEPKYMFRRDDKPEISDELFAYCLYEYVQIHHADETSVPVHLVANGHGSPGQIFKIPEMYILNRLFMIKDSSRGYFVLQESAAVPMVVWNPHVVPPSLESVYSAELSYA